MSAKLDEPERQLQGAETGIAVIRMSAPTVVADQITPFRRSAGMSAYDITGHSAGLLDINEWATRIHLRALHAICTHLSINKQPATIVMPTGTRKTEAILAVQTAKGRWLRGR